MQNLVSVIIPTYGRPLHLSRAIKSVIDQTYNDIEIIIVDDNANNIKIHEETKAVVDSFNTYRQVKYIRNSSNLGGAESRNEGVKYSKGEYISFLDDDDIYENNKISAQMEIMENNKNIDVCYCGMGYLNENGKSIGNRDIYVDGSEELIIKHIFRPITGTPTLLMKREIFEQVGGFDNLKRFQDANFIFKILAHNFRITSVKEELVKVYIHEGQRISTTGNWIILEKEYIENALKYINLISYKSSKRLLDKYHILNCICNSRSMFYAIVQIIKLLKLRTFIFKNLLNIANYARKYNK